MRVERTHIMHPQAATRELTLKEQTTEDLKSQLEEAQSRKHALGYTSVCIEAKIDAIEAELEERSEYEQKVSRW